MDYQNSSNMQKGKIQQPVNIFTEMYISQKKMQCDIGFFEILKKILRFIKY